MNADYAVVRDLAILNGTVSVKGSRFSGLWRLPVVLLGIAAWLVLICMCYVANETWGIGIHVQGFITEMWSYTQAGSINSKQVWHRQDTE